MVEDIDWSVIKVEKLKDREDEICVNVGFATAMKQMKFLFAYQQITGNYKRKKEKKKW